ncbi:MAG TPA: hypothetical protein VFN55_02060 [Solirubrobacteraceae bacterium]|nr:hypothetical protein [Solirubrobacteraceae bacterium]
MRLGCIDIGSNTTRLLVADCDGTGLAAVHQERVFTRIGHEVLDHGLVRPAKVAEVVAVVAGQLRTARALGVTEIHAVATEAIRRAANGAELLDAVSAAAGVSVRVLTGEEEARLAFVGVAGTLSAAPAPGQAVGVADVGGGSSELVVGTPPRAIRWWVSVALGSTDLTHALLASDPPSAEQLAAARERVGSELAGLEPPQVALGVAVGGSATSLARIAGERLDAPALRRALELLVCAPAAVIASRHGIDPVRARLLPAGLLVLAGVAELFGTALRVGAGGIREGVLLEAAAR